MWLASACSSAAFWWAIASPVAGSRPSEPPAAVESQPEHRPSLDASRVPLEDGNVLCVRTTGSNLVMALSDRWIATFDADGTPVKCAKFVESSTGVAGCLFVNGDAANAVVCDVRRRQLEVVCRSASGAISSRHALALSGGPEGYNNRTATILLCDTETCSRCAILVQGEKRAFVVDARAGAVEEIALPASPNDLDFSERQGGWSIDDHEYSGIVACDRTLVMLPSQGLRPKLIPPPAGMRYVQGVWVLRPTPDANFLVLCTDRHDGTAHFFLTVSKTGATKWTPQEDLREWHRTAALRITNHGRELFLQTSRVLGAGGSVVRVVGWTPAGQKGDTLDLGGPARVVVGRAAVCSAECSVAGNRVLWVSYGDKAWIVRLREEEKAPGTDRSK
jgi:hypothetical protein